MSEEQPRTLDGIAIQLVRAHYDDEMSFDKATKELAEYYDGQGRYELSSYLMAQLPGAAGVFSTMEIDPLSVIAKDMYEIIERELGADNVEAVGFRMRLAFYFPDFSRRCRDERLFR